MEHERFHHGGPGFRERPEGVGRTTFVPLMLTEKGKRANVQNEIGTGSKWGQWFKKGSRTVVGFSRSNSRFVAVRCTIRVFDEPAGLTSPFFKRKSFGMP